jgi:hypothetical protein
LKSSWTSPFACLGEHRKVYIFRPQRTTVVSAGS